MNNDESRVKDCVEDLEFAYYLIQKGFEMAEEGSEYLVLADMCIEYGYYPSELELKKLEKVLKEELDDVDSWELKDEDYEVDREKAIKNTLNWVLQQQKLYLNY